MRGSYLLADVQEVHIRTEVIWLTSSRLLLKHLSGGIDSFRANILLFFSVFFPEKGEPTNWPFPCG